MAANKLENYDLPSVQPMGYSLNNTTDNTRKGIKRKKCVEKNIVLLWELVRNHELCVPAPFSKNSIKFRSEGICNNANSLPECQKLAYLMFRKIKFPWEASPRTPLFIM